MSRKRLEPLADYALLLVIGILLAGFGVEYFS